MLRYDGVWSGSMVWYRMVGNGIVRYNGVWQ